MQCYIISFHHLLISHTLLQLDFKQQHGHCDVPQTYAPNPKLGVWVNKVSLSSFVSIMIMILLYTLLSSVKSDLSNPLLIL